MNSKNTARLAGMGRECVGDEDKVLKPRHELGQQTSPGSIISYSLTMYNFQCFL